MQFGISACICFSFDSRHTYALPRFQQPRSHLKDADFCNIKAPSCLQLFGEVSFHSDFYFISVNFEVP